MADSEEKKVLSAKELEAATGAVGNRKPQGKTRTMCLHCMRTIEPDTPENQAVHASGKCLRVFK